MLFLSRLWKSTKHTYVSVDTSVNVWMSRGPRLCPSAILRNMWMRVGTLSRGALVFFLLMNHSATPMQKRLSWDMKCKWSLMKPVRRLKHLFLEFFFFYSNYTEHFSTKHTLEKEKLISVMDDILEKVRVKTL